MQNAGTSGQHASPAGDDVAPGGRRLRELSWHVRRALAEVSGQLDYTYGHPSRRQASCGRVLMPALRRSPARVAVIVDADEDSTPALASALAAIARTLHGASPPAIVRVLAVARAGRTCARAFGGAAVAPGAVVDRRIAIDAGVENRLPLSGVESLSEGIVQAARLLPRVGVIVAVGDHLAAWPANQPRGVRLLAVSLDRSAVLVVQWVSRQAAETHLPTHQDYT